MDSPGYKPMEGYIVTPCILIGRKKLPPESAPSPKHVYDNERQLWIDKRSGEPLVTSMQSQMKTTQFGETTITETREGADRSESAAQASEFGETIQTRTHEGVDQTEGKLLEASQVGETTLTKTREGADRTEGSAVQEFDATYSHF